MTADLLSYTKTDDGRYRIWCCDNKNYVKAVVVQNQVPVTVFEVSKDDYTDYTHFVGVMGKFCEDLDFIPLGHTISVDEKLYDYLEGVKTKGGPGSGS